MAGNKNDRDKAVDALLDELLQGRRPEDNLNEGGLVQDLTERLVERALEGEMTDHLGYEKHAPEGRDGGNSRNGKTRKRIKTGTSKHEIEVPRDRDVDFLPKLVPKGRRRLPGFDDKVIALYARGMTTREIQEGLRQIYGVEVFPSLISAVTDSVLEDVKAWHPSGRGVPVRLSRRDPREDALFGPRAEHRRVRGLCHHALWVGENEGAKFWLSVLTTLKNRGVQDILIAAVDGLKGFPEAIESVYPKTQIQLCTCTWCATRCDSCLEGAQAGRCQLADDLHGLKSRRPSRPWPPSAASGMIAVDHQELACELGSSDALLRLSAGPPQGDLHDERHRVDQCSTAEGGEEKKRGRFRPSTRCASSCTWR